MRQNNEMGIETIRKKCAICGREAVLCHKGVRDNPDIDVYRCQECGTKFLSRFNKTDYEKGEMYETNYLSGLDIEERIKKFHDDDYRRYEMTKALCKNKKVLDFGCGFGGFLSLIESETQLCNGVELGKAEREYLEKKGIKVWSDIDESDQNYDVITLFHTFEHLDKPMFWLNKLYDHLVERGEIIIEVPNADDALLELYQCEKFADFTYWSAHLFLYTMNSLSMVIEKSNQFEIVEKKQVQRYPLANHLYWMSQGKPGGQDVWEAFNSDILKRAYRESLENMGMCDTLFLVLRKK